MANEAGRSMSLGVLCIATLLVLGVGSASARSTAGAILLGKPSTGQTILTATSVRFTWRATPYVVMTSGGSPLAYRVRFQIARDPGFTRLLLNPTFICNSPDTCPAGTTVSAFPSGTYYWRVTATYPACLAAIKAAPNGYPAGASSRCKPVASEVRSLVVSKPAAGTATTPIVHSAPKLKPLASTLQAGATGRLGFRASSNWSNLSISLGVFSGTHQIYAKSFKNLKAVAGVIYVVLWRPTKPGTYMFCGVAQDADGVKTPFSCAPITVT